MREHFTALLRLDARATQGLRLEPGRPRGLLWHFAVVLAHSGDSWLWMGGLVMVWLFDRGAWHDRAAVMALAVGAQALVIFVIKQLVRRERPVGEWGGIYRAYDPHSFPSGHATRAALLAVLAGGLGPGWFAIGVVLWAPLVSLARVATGVHYVSDIAAGMLIGLLMGLGTLALQDWLVKILPFLF